MVESSLENCLYSVFRNTQKGKEMVTDKKHSFMAGLKKIRENAKYVKFGEDKILWQVVLIMSCLFFVGYDMAFLYRQVQTHGFDVASVIRDNSWEQLATVFLCFAGADASLGSWSQLFKKTKKNIQNRMQDEKNQGR